MNVGISIIIITVIICYLILRYASSQKKQNNKQSQLSPPSKKIDYPDECYAWPALMNFEFPIVGESYYQNAIEKIAKQQEAKYTNNPDAKIEPLTAYLIPDDNNEYDNRAVRVDINGMQIGHLSREDARSFRRRLTGKKLTGRITICGALITGGETKNGKQMHYGVVLDMKPFYD